MKEINVFQGDEKLTEQLMRAFYDALDASNDVEMEDIASQARKLNLSDCVANMEMEYDVWCANQVQDKSEMYV